MDDGVITLEAVSVRSSTAELALEMAQVHRGDEVEILERRDDGWLKIRTSGGVEGWIEARAVTRKVLVQEANALAEQVKGIPPQAVGQLSGPTTLRLSPGRASDENVLLTLSRHTRVEILDRQRTLRLSQDVLAKHYQPTGRQAPPRPPPALSDSAQQYDYWYQVRLPDPFLVRAGWVYAPLVELQVPSRLIYYQQDYTIIGWFEVGWVDDPDIGPAAHYLALERQRFQSVPGTDFNRLRLFIWEVENHRYVSAWKPVDGIFPVLRQKRDGDWVFTVKAYDRKTGDLREARFLVDMRNPRRPQLRDLRRENRR